MSQSTSANSQFPHLKRLAAYMLENHLREASMASIALARKLEVPIMQLFAHMSEEELLAFTQESLQTFFQQLVAQTALQDAEQGLDQWRTDTLPNIPRGGVATADLVLVYHVRKQILLDFTARYTTDVSVALAIAKELDVFYAQLERLAFSYYVDIQLEDHQNLNYQLQETNNELTTALEELRATEEQLQETNNQLEDRIESRTRELATREQQIRLVTNTLPVLISYVDAEERYQFNNTTYEEWFNLPATEIYGKTILEISGPESYARVKPYINRVLAGEKLSYETQLNFPALGPREVSVNYVPHRNGSEVLGYFALINDITDQKKAQVALQESEERFRIFADSIQNLAWMAEPDGWIFWYNQRWYDYTGTTFEEMQGWGWEKVHHPDHVKRVTDFVKVAWLKGETWELIFPLRSAQGNWNWFLTRAYAVKDEQGNVIRWIGTNTDVNEQISTKEALEESRDQLQFAIEATELGTWEVDPTTNKLKANARLKDWFGLSPQEEVDLQLALDVITEEDRERVTAAIQRALQYESGGGYDITYTIVHPHTKQRRIVRAKGRAWFTENQEVYRFNGTLQDITGEATARKELEVSEKEAQALAEELASANEELQAANEAIQTSNDELYQTNQQLSLINADLDNFIYTASHDLRAPIANIEGLMRSLLRNLSEDSRQNEQVSKVTELINQSILRFKRTITDLTHIARIQKEGAEQEVSRVDLETVVQEVRLDLSQQIAEADTQIQTDFTTCTPVQFSAKNARSVVYNLLSNALKYRSPQRKLTVTISCQAVDDYLILAVKDNGLGMDISQKDKIFAMFKRLHNHVEGSGVGLHMVKRIIENAGGKIEVESQVDVGTTFRVFFKK
jgi:PAS domain S-box-containing protein